MFRLRFIFALAFCCLIGAACPAQNASFERLIDINNPAFISLEAGNGLVQISINEAGAVAFIGQDSAQGDYGIFTTSQTDTFTHNVDAGDTIFQGFTGLNINDSGTIAFNGNEDIFSTAVYTVNGTTLTRIADGNTPGLSGVTGVPFLRADGTVLFGGVRDAGGFGLYRAADQNNVIPMYEPGDPTLAGINLSAPVLLPDSSAVTVGRLLPDVGGPEGVFRIDAAGNVLTLARADADPFSFTIGAASATANGYVAFQGTRDTTGEAGVYLRNPQGVLSDIGSSFAPTFGGALVATPAVNSQGNLIYLGYETGFSSRITGYSSATNSSFTVLNAGDSLFGHSVVALRAISNLTENNQFAFRYSLDNGDVGIARATVIFPTVAAPEPATGALALTLSPLLLCALRRRNLRARSVR